MKKIAIIDSGSGGINVLMQCLNFAPKNAYMLYIDDKNLPYGDKNKIELLNIARDIVLKLKNTFSPDIIIIGCNSLTSTTLPVLKEEFWDITFIGTQPNLEDAQRDFEDNKICVLATKVTIQNSPILQNTRAKLFSPIDLPSIIDRNLFNRDKIVEYLRKVLPKEEYSAYVLGCTHFEGIKEEILRVKPNVKLYVSGEKVAKQLGKTSTMENSPQVKIMLSSGKRKGELIDYFNSQINSLMRL